MFLSFATAWSSHEITFIKFRYLGTKGHREKKHCHHYFLSRGNIMVLPVLGYASSFWKVFHTSILPFCCNTSVKLWHSMLSFNDSQVPKVMWHWPAMSEPSENVWKWCNHPLFCILLLLLLFMLDYILKKNLNRTAACDFLCHRFFWL